MLWAERLTNKKAKVDLAGSNKGVDKLNSRVAGFSDSLTKTLGNYKKVSGGADANQLIRLAPRSPRPALSSRSKRA